MQGGSNFSLHTPLDRYQKSAQLKQGWETIIFYTKYHQDDTASLQISSLSVPKATIDLFSCVPISISVHLNRTDVSIILPIMFRQ